MAGTPILKELSSGQVQLMFNLVGLIIFSYSQDR